MTDRRHFCWQTGAAMLCLWLQVQSVSAQNTNAQNGLAPNLQKSPEAGDLSLQPRQSFGHNPEASATPYSVARPSPLTTTVPFLRPILNAGEQLIERAKTLLGIPYRYGGNSPDIGFDCSGLVRYIFREALGVSLATRSEEIGRTGERLDDASLSPGDLVFFNTLNRPFSHVGIYVGNRQFLHAPSSGGVVRIESMALPYWTKRYQGARRMVSLDEQASTLSGVTPDLAHGAEILSGFANVGASNDQATGPLEIPAAGLSNGGTSQNTGQTSGANSVKSKSTAYRAGKANEQLKSPDALDSFLKKLKVAP
jgi:cell wall-associated NlpC family hydrolase